MARQLRKFIGTGTMIDLDKRQVEAMKKVYQAILKAKKHPVSLTNIRWRTKQKLDTIRHAIYILSQTIPAACLEGTLPLIKFEKQIHKRKKYVSYYKIWPIDQGGFDEEE